jgi:hypothetical protein
MHILILNPALGVVCVVFILQTKRVTAQSLIVCEQLLETQEVNGETVGNLCAVWTEPLGAMKLRQSFIWPDVVPQNKSRQSGNRFVQIGNERKRERQPWNSELSRRDERLYQQRAYMGKETSPSSLPPVVSIVDMEACIWKHFNSREPI